MLYVSGFQVFCVFLLGVLAGIAAGILMTLAAPQFGFRWEMYKTVRSTRKFINQTHKSMKAGLRSKTGQAAVDKSE